MEHRGLKAGAARSTKEEGATGLMDGIGTMAVINVFVAVESTGRGVKA